MSLDALLLSHDPEVLRILRRVLSDLGMKVEVCTGAERASEWLERKRCDVAIVDVDDLPGAGAVLNEMRQTSANRNTLTFALLNGTTTPRQAFELGANLTLEKPLSMDKAVSSFRAANVLVLSERRRFYRHRVDVPLTVVLEGVEIAATGTDVSAGGMAARLPKPLAAKTSVQLRFKLPGSKTWIGTAATVAWADDEGRTGLRFEHMPASARREFERWENERERPQEEAAEK